MVICSHLSPHPPTTHTSIHLPPTAHQHTPPTRHQHIPPHELYLPTTQAAHLSCMCCLAFPHRRVMLTSSLLSSGQCVAAYFPSFPSSLPSHPPTYPPLPFFPFAHPLPPLPTSSHSISPPLTLLLLSSPSLSDEGGQLDFSVVSEGSIPRSLLDPSDGNHFRLPSDLHPKP